MKSSQSTGRVPVAPVKKRRPVTSASSGLIITNSRNTKITKKASSTKQEAIPQSSPSETPTISRSFRSLLDKNASVIQHWFKNIMMEKKTRREKVSSILQSHKNLRVRPSSSKKSTVGLQRKKETQYLDKVHESASDLAVRKRREAKAKSARNVSVPLINRN
jgi:hypothetical protein